jgi:hypothetical protein
VPKIQPASKEAREPFRGRLPESQRSLFDHLVRLVAQHRTTLDWYHAVGSLVRDLHDAIPGAQRGKGWTAALARALGVSPSLLQKAARFVELYREPGEVEALEEMGLDWTRLSLTFAVEGSKRSEFQQRAVENDWSPQEVRLRIQEEQGSRQQIGGRPRRLPKGYRPEVALREMARISQHWKDLHEQVWEGKESVSRQLKQLPKEKHTQALLRDLQTAEEALTYLGKNWEGVRRTVTALRQRVERAVGNTETGR